MAQTEVDIMVATVSRAWKIPVVVPGVDIGGLGREDQELIAEYGFPAWIAGMVRKFNPLSLGSVDHGKPPKTRRVCPECSNGFYARGENQFCSKECSALCSRQQAQKSL